jgi:signal transduction histidine kinase
VIRRIREFLKKKSTPAALLDIKDVVQEALSLAQAELIKRQVSVRTELSSELPLVRGDRIQLQQVILNLLMNGAEAMASTEGQKDLLVMSSRADDGQVLIAVRDRGTGVEPENIHKIFDAFFSTKDAGMGMGLSISRSIIEAHGGRIWAELNDGPGLTVQFSLPGHSEGEE